MSTQTIARGTKVEFTYIKPKTNEVSIRCGFVDETTDKVLRLLPEVTPEGFKSFSWVGVADLRLVN